MRFFSLSSALLASKMSPKFVLESIKFDLIFRSISEHTFDGKWSVQISKNFVFPMENNEFWYTRLFNLPQLSVKNGPKKKLQIHRKSSLKTASNKIEKYKIFWLKIASKWTPKCKKKRKNWPQNGPLVCTTPQLPHRTQNGPQNGRKNAPKDSQFLFWQVPIRHLSQNISSKVCNREIYETDSSWIPIRRSDLKSKSAWRNARSD